MQKLLTMIGAAADLTTKALAAAVAIGAVLPMSALAELPSGYRQLDYVDTDGNQWVNTLFVPSCTNAVEIKASILDKLSTSQFLYCSRKTTSGSDRRYYSLCIYNSKPRFDYSNGQNTGNTLIQGDSYVFSANPSEDTDQDGVAEVSKKWTQTGSGNGIAAVAAQSFFMADSSAPFCLFGSYAGSLNDSTSVGYKATCRFWYFKVWDTKDKTNLLCHIVPVYSEVEAAVGLYDVVAGRFLPVHGNAFSGAYTLTQDEDWSDEATMLSSDITVDLAGHNLAAATVVKNATSSVAGSGYQDLDFVLATGAQGIRISGFRLPGTAKVEMKFRPGIISGNQWLFFSRTDGTVETYSVNLYSTGKLRFDFNNKTTYSSAVLSAGKAYELVFDGSSAKPTWYIDGTEEQDHAATSNDFTSGSDLTLFGSGVNGGTKCRLYRFKVTNGDAVLLDLHPVRRISDGVVGLYDSVGPAFYPSGSATAFPGFATPKFANTSATVSELRVGQELIDGYTLVDCIIASSFQHIDTGLVPASTDRIEIKASMANGNSNRGLFCSRDSNFKNALTAIYTDVGKIRFDFNANTQKTTTFTPGDDTIFTVALDGNTQRCYGNGELLHTFDVGNDFTPSANLFIFALHKAGESVGYRPSGSIYSFKVTGADGALKLDMVPVVRASDSKAGLFDRVNRKFFPSSSARAFTAGSQVGDGKLYVDKDSAFDATEIAGNVTLVKNGNGAFDGCGTTVAGTLKSTAGTVSGVMLQSGATLDLSAISDPFSLDDNAISFADSAIITIDLGSRTATRKMPLVSWTTAPANLGTLKFGCVAGASRGFVVKADGIYLAPKGLIISFF